MSGTETTISPPDIAVLEDKIARLEAQLAKRLSDPAYPENGYLRTDVAPQLLEAKRRLREARKRRTADLARLHVARKDLGLDADTWKMTISGLVAGRTTSSGALTAVERKTLIGALKARGWTPTRSPGRRVRRFRVPETKEALAGKVRALLLDAGRPDAYADAIASSRFAVERWEWLDWEALKKLMQMLVIDQRRRQKSTGDAG